MQPPLDLAAQITLLAWTARESPDNEKALQSVLLECLRLAGLVDINALNERKEDGFSVFGVLPVYPQGTTEDIATIRSAIALILSQIPEPIVPRGMAIATGPNWQMVTPDVPAHALTIADTYYQPPYIEPAALPQVAPIETPTISLPSEAGAFIPTTATTTSEAVTESDYFPSLPAPMPVANRGFAVNLDPVINNAVSYPFTDVFKMAGAWVPNLISGGWNNGGALGFDANGYVRSLPPGTKATIGLFVDTRNYPLGDYVLLWEGTGTFTPGLGSATTVSSAPGRLVLNALPNKSGLWISLTSIDPDNYPGNIRLILPGYEGLYTSQIFNPEFLDRLSPFTWLRFTSWSRTNSSIASSWSNRRTMAYYTQGDSIGVSWDYAISLLNLTDKTGWVNIPHQADNLYVQRLAELFRDNLDPKIRIYLEYSNECWNPALSQYNYCLERARAIAISADTDNQKRLRFYSQRSVECFQIWQDVFGLSFSERVVRVVGTQFDSPQTTNEILLWQGAFESIDAVAIAPWVEPVFYTQSANGAAISQTTADKVLDDLLVEIRGGIRRKIRAQREVSDSYPRLQFLLYESGVKLESDRMSAALRTEITALYQRVLRHPRMRGIYREYLETLYAEMGGASMSLAGLATPISQYGALGALEYQGQPVSSAPRYQAILDYVSNVDWVPEP